MLLDADSVTDQLLAWLLQQRAQTYRAAVVAMH